MTTDPSDLDTDYPYTGGEFPDRTAETLVHEATALALAEVLGTIETELGLEISSDETDYAFDIRISQVESVIDPSQLPVLMTYGITLIEHSDVGPQTTVTPVSGEDGEPLLLASGGLGVSVRDGDANASTNYGADISPERVETETSNPSACAHGPHHTVHVSAHDLGTDTINRDALETVKQRV